jgi:hypothetical protein
MTRIDIDGVTQFMPSGWHELTWQESIMVASYLVTCEKPVPDRVKLLILLMLWKGDDSQLHKLDDDQYKALFETMNWIETPPKKPPVKSIRVGWLQRYLPEYGELRIIELAMGDMHLRQFTRDQNLDALNSLVAVLCRPKKWWLRIFPFLSKWNTDWDGDKRIKFNSGVITATSEAFVGANFFFKLYAMWWFIQLKHRNAELFKDLSGGDGELIDAIYSVAETGVFGDMDKVFYQPVSNFMYYLRTKKKQADERARTA